MRSRSAQTAKPTLRLVIVALFAGTTGVGQVPVAWEDQSGHQVRFVTVEKDIQLEVLDWGGIGRNIVLLAGSGNTAHVFDGFALRLKQSGHVFGITRRGFGASSHPEAGYDDQRLADDVLQVLDVLSIFKPVLVGHSLGGSEMTTPWEPALGSIGWDCLSRCGGRSGRLSGRSCLPCTL